MWFCVEYQVVVVGAKLLLLCDLFTKRKNELSREERHEIIRYAKSRLPIFMTQLQKFLHAVKVTFSSMTAQHRNEVAEYLVPEVNPNYRYKCCVTDTGGYSSK